MYLNMFESRMLSSYNNKKKKKNLLNHDFELIYLKIIKTY